MADESLSTMTPEMIRNAFGVDMDLQPEPISEKLTADPKLMNIQYEDPVNHPTHYTSGTIECIDYIDSCGYGLDFCLANAIKYLTRCKLKGTPEQDIRKAIWYATHAAEGLRKGMYKINE